MTKRKGLPISHGAMVANIEAWLARATDSQYLAGKAWYNAAAGEARTLAAEYGKSFYTVCGIIAALSPHVAWEINLKDARAILELRGKARVSTYGANKKKALRILRGEAPSDVLGGDKVRAFYFSIASEGNTLAVCIDRHGARAALGCSLVEAARYLNRAGCYQAIVDAYIAVASRQFGITATQLQAIVWLVFRAHETKVLDEVPF